MAKHEIGPANPMQPWQEPMARRRAIKRANALARLAVVTAMVVGFIVIWRSAK